MANQSTPAEDEPDIPNVENSNETDYDDYDDYGDVEVLDLEEDEAGDCAVIHKSESELVDAEKAEEAKKAEEPRIV
ncbi:hypothetical protein NUW58_g8653 [Xylaria curta]|uniref:Uncharacterized protein n=1 Tax=Xylaria curta TaxID=42375 RepID=A0ACC1N770_9PEZI|nr:hypothetical protein NUW58_g8653 [Xylaria curta]